MAALGLNLLPDHSILNPETNQSETVLEDTMAEVKYKLIAEELKRRMREGELSDRLPSQRALMREFGVSSRTLHKVFSLLKHQNCIVPTPRGTAIDTVPPQPDRSPRLYLFSSGNPAELEFDPLGNQLRARCETDHYQLQFHCAHSLSATELVQWDFLPGDGCIFVYSSFRREYLPVLRKRHIPFVVANRMPPEFGVHWVDWNHLELFDNIVGQLVARGAREIGFLLYHTFSEQTFNNLAMIAADFLLAKRAYSLYNKELDAFPLEKMGDIAAYVDFLAGLKRLPDVILVFNNESWRRLAAALSDRKMDAAIARLLLIGSIAQSNSRYHNAGFYDAPGYRKMADKIWTLFRHVAANPELAPCGLKQRCTMKYCDDFRKTKKISTVERKESK